MKPYKHQVSVWGNLMKPYKHQVSVCGLLIETILTLGFSLRNLDETI